MAYLFKILKEKKTALFQALLIKLIFNSDQSIKDKKAKLLFNQVGFESNKHFQLIKKYETTKINLKFGERV